MRRWQLGLLAAVNAVVATLLGLLSSVAAQDLPPVVVRHPVLVWTAVGIFTFAAIGCAILLLLGDHPSDGDHQRSARQSENGVRIGRDLQIRGQGNTVAGGDINNVDLPRGQSAFRPSKRRL
jgi:fatty acid desaturase